MKTSLIFLPIALTAIFITSNAQIKVGKSESELVRTEKDLRSGNFSNILTNFFQVAFTDIVGKDKSFQFKGTLFGIKSKIDSSILVDSVFKMHKWDRNTQFDFSVHATDAYKFNNYSMGLTLGIINNRDKKLADFRKTELHSLHNYYSERLILIERQYWDDPKKGGRLSEEEKRDMEQKIADGWAVFDSTNSTKSFPLEIKEMYESVEPLERNKLNALYDSLMDDIGKRGFLGARMSARTDSVKNVFNEANFDLFYLKGKNIILDLRSNLRIKDTITANTKDQLRFMFQAGANMIALRSKNDKRPLLEIKPNLEFSSILSHRLPDQQNYFSLNVDFNIRITNEIWLPVVVKYDPLKNNFLGFLNVAVNMNAFK